MAPIRPPVSLALLLAADAGLVLLHVASAAVLGGVPKLFDLDEEANLPAWWSSAQLLVAGLLVSLVALKCLRAGRSAWPLGGLAAVLVFLSLDESVSIHERLGLMLDRLPHLDRSDSGLFANTGYWPLAVGLPAAAAIGYVTWKSASALSGVSGARGRFLLGFLFLFGGALGVELLNNVESAAIGEIFEIIEEAMEMIGGSVLLWSAADLVGRHPLTGPAWSALRSG